MICIGTYDVFEDTEMLAEGNDDDNWPKRRETRRLGLHVSFFFVFVVLSVYLTMEIGTTDALKVRRGPVGRQQPRQRAQMTQDASFGP